jgi:hypothetical protein
LDPFAVAGFDGDAAGIHFGTAPERVFNLPMDFMRCLSISL